MRRRLLQTITPQQGGGDTTTLSVPEAVLMFYLDCFVEWTTNGRVLVLVIPGINIRESKNLQLTQVVCVSTPKSTDPEANTELT